MDEPDLFLRIVKNPNTFGNLCLIGIALCFGSLVLDAAFHNAAKETTKIAQKATLRPAPVISNVIEYTAEKSSDPQTCANAPALPKKDGIPVKPRTLTK